MTLIEWAISYLTGRGSAYRQTFPKIGVAQNLVLADLAVFCRANETCAAPGDRDRSLLLEGRREVWLRIQQHLNLTPEQLYALYNANTASRTVKEN